MSEELANLMTEFSLGIISENDQKKLNILLASVNKSEKLECKKLNDATSSLALTANSIELKPDIKVLIFSKLSKYEKSKSKKSRNFLQISLIQFISTIAATILISVSFALYFRSIESKNLIQPTKSELAQFAHLEEVEKVALCSHVKEQVLNSFDKSVITIGKIYVNMPQRSLVLHICILPKLKKGEYFTIWSIDSDGFLNAIESIKMENGIREKNFVFGNLANLNKKMHFSISVEDTEAPKKPSERILLKS